MTYEYACAACGHEWEAEQSIRDQPLKKCPKCGKLQAKRQISRGAGFILKGGGWYADGYGSAGSASGSGTKGSGSSTASSSSSSSTDSTASSSSTEKSASSSSTEKSSGSGGSKGKTAAA
jgi:putative FmdB family regulatory protein